MSTTPLQEQPKPRRKRFIPNYNVEGVVKVVLSEEDQTAIDMIVGTHVNAQYPWKSVPKAKLIEHIEAYRQKSVFIGLHNDIEAYKDDEILIGYIPDESKDDDEFYICITKEATEHCKQQSDKFIRRQEKKLEKSVQKKPRPWTSLGSEAEILQLVPVNSRTLFEIEVKAKFPKATDPDKFLARDTTSVRDGFIELTPYRQKFYIVYRKRIDVGCQAAPGISDREAQTLLRYPKNIWTQAIADAVPSMEDTQAGGDVNVKQTGKTEELDDLENQIESSDDDSDDEPPKPPVDEAALEQYQKAFGRLKRTSYVKAMNGFLSSRYDEMESIIELNTVMDMYCDDYPLLKVRDTEDVQSSMLFSEYVCFTDVRAKDKFVSCAVFHPMWSGIVAIAYADGCPSVMQSSAQKIDPIARAVYGLNPVMIWSHIDSLFPKLVLISPREVKVLSFCPFNENILIGGCCNGQLVLWDLTHKLENVETMVVLSEKREKYKIAMNAHMGWMKSVQDKGVIQPTVLSNLKTSHSAKITEIRWLSPNFNVLPSGKLEMADEKKSIIVMTASEDGTILIWNLSLDNITNFEGKKVKKSKRVPVRPAGLMEDVSAYSILDRNLRPCFKINTSIINEPNVIPLQSFAIDCLKLKYIYTPRNTGTGRTYYKCELIDETENEIPRVIYAGSMHGKMLKIAWEGSEFNTGEVVNSATGKILFDCCIHDGIITAVHRSSFLPGITLTVGGKIFAIWTDQLSNRPLFWKKRRSRLTDGLWSLYKPSIIFITTSDGTLETWDFVTRSDKPVSIQTLSGTPLTSISIHTLPIARNMLAVGDMNGSFSMFLVPPVFMTENEMFLNQMNKMVMRELRVLKKFLKWQQEWMDKNPDIILQRKLKEETEAAEKEEEKRKQKEEEEKRAEEEAEAKKLAKLIVIGPEERWQKIVQKLIEKTIAVKKSINLVELMEQEKPLKELEAQRKEKEKRMLEIMKNQKNIFNDTVAILFPEALKKKEKEKKTFLPINKDIQKQNYLKDYNQMKANCLKAIKQHPFKAEFSWDALLQEGKERRQSLHTDESFVQLHRQRLKAEIEPDEGKISATSKIEEFEYVEIEESITE